MNEKVEKIALYKASDGTVFTDRKKAEKYQHFEKFYFDLEELFKSDDASFPFILSDQDSFKDFIMDDTFHRFMKKFINLYKKHYPHPVIPPEQSETDD